MRCTFELEKDELGDFENPDREHPYRGCKTMGHTRLGSVPSTTAWDAVTKAFAEAGAVPGTPQEALSRAVASAAAKTLSAADAGLSKAASDLGLSFSFYALTQLVLSARNPNWIDRISRIGVSVSGDSTLFHLVASVQESIDQYLIRRRYTSDVSDIAQKAVGHALFATAGPKAVSLFGETGEELRLALRAQSTKKGFGELAQVFFGSFMSQFLNFYLSRITASQLGKDVVRRPQDISEFNNQLREYCQERAYVVRDFAAQWYSKTEFEVGIDLENVSRFTAVAINKLKAELRRQSRDE